MKQRLLRLSLILESVLLLLLLLLLCLITRNRPASTESTPGTSETTTMTAVPSTIAPTEPTTIPPTTVPPTTVPPTTAPPITVPPTTVPPETVPPTTAPPETTAPTSPHDEYIGSLYTRSYLETLDTTLKGYGPGRDVDNRNRPVYATQLTEQFKRFDAHFIAPDDGNIYLSFNCGYEYNNLTTVVLDVLREKDVKAVFFVNRHFIEANPALIQRIIDEGHIIANHCTKHPDLPRLSIDGIVSEIMTLHDYMLDTYGYKMNLFRPPSGYYSEQVLAIAQSLGYRTYNFSFSYRDWEEEDQPDPEESLAKFIAKAHSGAIYQLHTVSDTNAQFIGPFIDAMRGQGYSFALLPQP